MDSAFEHRIEAIAAETVAERAEAAGRSVEDEVMLAREQAPPLTIPQKLALSARLRAMTPRGCTGTDSTLVIRWYRDTHGGRWTDDGWSDDDGR